MSILGRKRIPSDAEVDAVRRELANHREGSSPRPDLTTSCSCGAINPATDAGWMEQARHGVREALIAARAARTKEER